MKYGLTRKINLANIDKSLYAFETEDIIITDADTLDEAAQSMERLVAERIAFHRGRVEAMRSEKAYVGVDHGKDDETLVIQVDQDGERSIPTVVQGVGKDAKDEASYETPADFDI